MKPVKLTRVTVRIIRLSSHLRQSKSHCVRMDVHCQSEFRTLEPSMVLDFENKNLITEPTSQMSGFFIEARNFKIHTE